MTTRLERLAFVCWLHFNQYNTLVYVLSVINGTRQARGKNEWRCFGKCTLLTLFRYICSSVAALLCLNSFLKPFSKTEAVCSLNSWLSAVILTWCLYERRFTNFKQSVMKLPDVCLSICLRVHILDPTPFLRLRPIETKFVVLFILRACQHRVTSCQWRRRMIPALSRLVFRYAL